ncbi:MAG TPA: DUF2889 domain-containing protein [Casimicrobiaceae bacterium]|nr:DUF2889 domain-containing protein [Casimicrobiaceae bacterium]
MPLSSPVHRNRVHVRNVRYEAFARDDGLFDVEAHMTDVKDHGIALLTGVRSRGEPIHDMWVRMTVDTELTIHDVEASTDAMPYPGACQRIVGAYRNLIGANLLAGFRRTLHDTLGGIKGCTHLTELMGYFPTVGVQMLSGLRKREDAGDVKPFQLDRCHALDTQGDVARRYYPKWYRGDVETPEKAR